MENKLISGEDYQALRHKKAKNQGHSLARKLAPLAVIAILLAAGILGWHYYQKNHDALPQGNDLNQQGALGGNSSNSMPAGGGENGNGQRGTGNGSIRGKVTAVSASSITVQSTSDNNAHTLAITSSTSISSASTSVYGDPDSGEAKASDIHVGDTVVVIPDSSNSSQAVGILINPR